MNETETVKQSTFPGIFLLMILLTTLITAPTVLDAQQGSGGSRFLIAALDVPAIPPGTAGVVRDQVMQLVAAAMNIDGINRIDFFKPYNQKAKEDIASLLRQGADIEPDPCHKQYLYALAHQVTNDTFYTVTPEWSGLEQNQAEILFLPNRDHLIREYFLRLFLPKEHYKFFKPQDLENYFSQKQRRRKRAAKEQTSKKILDVFVYLNDNETTDRYRQYTLNFGLMRENQPVSDPLAVPYIPHPPEIKVARLVYSSLPATLSLIYPGRDLFTVYNREKVKSPFKIVVFKNLCDTYTDCILKPIGDMVLADTAQALKGGKTVSVAVTVDSDAFLSNLVMQKIAHHIGPVFTQQVKKDPRKTLSKEGKRTKPSKARKGDKIERELKPVAEILKAKFQVTENLKSDVIAIHNTSVLLKNGMLNSENEVDVYAAYLVRLIDKLRSKPKHPDNTGNVVQFNYLLSNGAIFFNIDTKKISINLSFFPTAVKNLAELILDKYTSPYSLYREYGQVGPELEAIILLVSDIPNEVVFQFQPQANQNDSNSN